MSAPQSSPAASAPGSSSGSAQEYVVRVPKAVHKKHHIMKFHHGLKIDLTKCGPLKMMRENNLKDYKLSYNMDAQPKFGAGSEFGRDQKEEARRKKYGIYRKKYNPDDQPWLMKIGEGKESKKFKGSKEGGISDNVSYFVFTQCPDGAFDAYHIEDWYHFTPQIKYKCLNAEEAEEEYSRRDKTLNYFSIMVNKKIKEKDEVEEDEEEKKKAKKDKKKKKDFLLTEIDEWELLSDGDVEDGSDEDMEDGQEKPKKAKKGKQKTKTKKSSRKTNSDDEALEESDSFDEGDEVDYMTDSDSNDEDMYGDKDREEGDKYKDTGVEDEDGLKKLIDSDEDEEEEKKDDEEEDEDEENPDKKKKEKKDDSDSLSSASSDSDSDPEKDTGFTSALFMQKKNAAEKKKSSENRSRSATPTEEKVKKRKADTASPVPKKAKLETSSTPTLTPSSSASNLATEGISEEAVRRYLMRKPMTPKHLVQKFNKTGLGKEQLVTTIAKILRKIDPEKTKIKGQLYLCIKQKE